ncbi:MAG: homoserine dehydrogenase, partial [Eubacteriales bacterium]|nr:homoserine dehydrogenase [Eubacteriales bacterium]
MVYAAVLGYGVVGSGVVEVIDKNRESIKNRCEGEEIKVKKILDIRDFDGPYAHLRTNDAEEIFNDGDIRVIIETIGGTGVAYEFTKRALSLGKHVVTSNKELVATRGPELLQLAHDNHVSYMFEASVGGGIPIIRPLNQCLSANKIIGITGILNGTSNYILSRIRLDGMSFEAALENARRNGYAEANPEADV